MTIGQKAVRTKHQCSKPFPRAAISRFITRDATNKFLSPVTAKATYTLTSVKQAGGVFLTKNPSKAKKRKEDPKAPEHKHLC